MKPRCASALAVFLCLVSTVPGATPSPPDTPAGRRIQALLQAFEAGTPDAIGAFVSANFAADALKEAPASQRAERLGGMARETGPLEFHRVIRRTPEEAVFLARSKKTGDWLEIGMRLEASEPYGIRGFRFEEAPDPNAPKEGRKGSDAEVAAAADAHLARLAEAGEFAGVVLIAKDGKPFCQKAYGLADRGLGVPNRIDTKFNLGSINKIFTQTAIAQLAEKGKLSFTDTIRKHLPAAMYPLAAADRITIQQLVTMSSGLGDFFGEKYDATPKSRIRTLQDYLALFANDPLLFEPGTSRRYSNAGYIVLGLIIEKVSGKTYYDYVRENIYAPAGMTASDSFPQDAVVPNRATGYTGEDENEKPLSEPRSNIYTLPGRGSSAGGGYSTAEDLLRFDLAMRGGKLLSPAGTAWFYSDRAAPPSGPQPASSGRSEPEPEPPKLAGGRGAAGGAPGVNATLEMDLDTGYTVVVLSNLDPPSAEKVGRTLRQWLGLD
jgi:CubicO group peptidase (beta-lactamase class C family)